jgi:hypothetical protein
MSRDVVREVLELVVQLRREGRRVVGVDLCEDPTVGFVKSKGTGPCTRPAWTRPYLWMFMRCHY